MSSDLTKTVHNPDVAFEFGEFFRTDYADTIRTAIQEEASSVTISYDDVRAFNAELADGIVEEPLKYHHTAQRELREFCDEEANKKIYGMLIDDDENPLRYANLRFEGCPNVKPVRALRADDVTHMLSIEGRVKRQSEVQPRLDFAAYICDTCGDFQLIKQPLRGKRVEPNNGCVVDGCSGQMDLNWSRSHKVDFEKLTVEESPEDLKGGETPQSISFFGEGDITGQVAPGERVTVTGVLEPYSENNSPVFDTHLRGTHVRREEEDYDELVISDEDIERIEALADDPDIYEKVTKSIAPAIWGLEQQKLSLAFAVFGGVKKERSGSYIRGDIHVLLVGDPGTGKSSCIKYINKISPRGVFTSGKNSTGAGLTAAAVQEEGLSGEKAWTLEAGALVLADKGIAAIDELDKMDASDRGSLHEALESQEISVSKAGINTTLKSRCSLVAAANPKHGRFDEFMGIYEQIELDPALMSRFDLVFTITDNPDEGKDGKLADHVIKVNQSETADEDKTDEPMKPPIEPELFRKYVAYARKQCRPKIPDEVREMLKEFYVDVRNQQAEGGPVPLTIRKLQALIRLAEASARIRLAEEVTQADAQNAINLTRASLEDVGMDPETGELDADIMETGRSKTQRDRAQVFETVLKDLRKEEDDPGVGLDLLRDVLVDNGSFSERQLQDHIDRLLREGTLFEPRTERYDWAGN
jgi:replicative DNA helicase Mcm